jgi:phenylalanine-4-hydroxylase
MKHCENTELCRSFASTIPRKFGVRYNPYTQSVDVLDTPMQLTRYTSHIKGEMTRLEDAMKKFTQYH